MAAIFNLNTLAGFVVGVLVATLIHQYVHDAYQPVYKSDIIALQEALAKYGQEMIVVKTAEKNDEHQRCLRTMADLFSTP